MKAVKAMRINRLVTVLVGVIAISIFATDAAAYFHPKMGRFISRDPGPSAAARTAATSRFIPRDPTSSNQYADGMSLYQYVRSAPAVLVDPQGTASIPSDLLRDWGDLESRKDYSNSQGDPATEGWLHEKIEGLKGQLGGPWRKVVMDRSERMGVMYFNKYRTDVLGDYKGVELDGGFVSWKKDLSLPPHCCKDIRWAQLVMTNKPLDGATSPYIDNYDENDVLSDILYWDTSSFSKGGLRNSRSIKNRKTGGALSAGYDLRFRDVARRKVPGPKRWRAELCLVCVTSKVKKELRYLQCVEYGFEIKAEDVFLAPQTIWDKGKGMPRHHNAVRAAGWTIK